MSASRHKVLVVDDKENLLHLLAQVLGEHHEVTTASDGARAIALVASQEFDVVLTDVRMPGADGFEVLRRVKDAWPYTEVVVMTAYASVQAAVEAIKLGAYDYLQKPFDPDDVNLVVARALERRRLRREAAKLPGQMEAQDGFLRLVGRSAAMQRVYTLIRQAAEFDINVLITGESGTGKELAARAIHAASARRSGPFVAVNCGALPSDLIESELFGHAKGAFSGATAAKPGLWEEATDGTLFLDEIGELPLGLQVKLNRALQEKEVRRVGENRALPVNARLVAATNRDLGAEVTAGRFREDLLYRLKVFPIHLPAVRERADDVPLLADHFLQKIAAAHKRAVTGFEPEALQAVCAYAWPGNVRELENAIERAVAVSTGPRLAVHDLPTEVRGAAATPPADDRITSMPFKEFVDMAREKGSRDYLEALLRRFGGNVSWAAETAGMERESLHRLLKRYGVRADEFRGDERPASTPRKDEP